MPEQRGHAAHSFYFFAPRRFIVYYSAGISGTGSNDCNMIMNNETVHIFESFKNMNHTNISSSVSKLHSNMYSITNYTNRLHQLNRRQAQLHCYLYTNYKLTIIINIIININGKPITNPCTSTHPNNKIEYDPLHFHCSRPNYANENINEIDKTRSYIQNALSKNATFFPFLPLPFLPFSARVRIFRIPPRTSA